MTLRPVRFWPNMLLWVADQGPQAGYSGLMLGPIPGRTGGLGNRRSDEGLITV